MNYRNTFTHLVAAAALAGTSTLVNADVTEHSNLIECYASVSAQCNQVGGCDDEGYEFGFSQCDGYYPDEASSTPRPFGRLKGLQTQSTGAIQGNAKTRLRHGETRR